MIRENHQSQNTPLVSIIVITYNSARFVLETLESANAQTYENIELIVSDDASTDDTVEICRNWLNENQDRFVRTELITVPENTGIPANCNRGVKAARGEWIKLIAGDDAFYNDAIENFVELIRDKPEIKVLFSFLDEFLENLKDVDFISKRPKNANSDFFNPQISANEQYLKLLLHDLISFTPTAFMYREVIISVGGFDESFKLIEDYPMWLKLTRAGYKLHFASHTSVMYRKHSNAIHNHTFDYIIKPSYFRNQDLFKKYVYPNLPIFLLYKRKYNYLIAVLFNKIGINKKRRLYILLYIILIKFGIIFSLFNSIHKKVFPKQNINHK
jgi:glycosyltransferase involved in cell wall biosynthesis